jgi:hypothetical protein
MREPRRRQHESESRDETQETSGNDAPGPLLFSGPRNGGSRHGIPGHDLLIAYTGHHLAGVQANPTCECHSVVTIEIRVESGEGGSHLGCGANGPKGIVLVRLGDPEYGHDGVADELLNRRSVRLEHRLHSLEVTRHHVSQGFGIESFAKGRRAGHVAEHDRDRLANLGPWDGPCDGCGALPAELVRLRVVVSAYLTPDHVRSLERWEGSREMAGISEMEAVKLSVCQHLAPESSLAGYRYCSRQAAPQDRTPRS